MRCSIAHRTGAPFGTPGIGAVGTTTGTLVRVTSDPSCFTPLLRQFLLFALVAAFCTPACSTQEAEPIELTMRYQ